MSIGKPEHEIASPNGSADGNRHLRVIHAREPVNLPAAERAVRDLLLAALTSARLSTMYDPALHSTHTRD